MTGGLSLPCPIYKYKGKNWYENFGVCFGSSGFTVARHVHIQLKSNWITWLAWVMKFTCMALFIIHEFYMEKGYLQFAHTQGISRMQLQHPTKSCNPLTQQKGGCATDFTNVEDLSYCTQSGEAGKKGKNIKQEKCEYFDEFDVQLPGYQMRQLMIPTRRTKYVQDVDCSKSEEGEPCPRNDHLKQGETVYVADVEDFTLLIDHSFVNDEIGAEMNAWEMLGFVNPCGFGMELGADVKEKMEAVMGEKKEEKCEEQQYMPVHRPIESLNHEEKEELDKREVGFAMWMSPWLHTFLPFMAPDPKKLAMHHPAPIKKIKNGDVIKVKDLLEFTDIDLDRIDQNGGSDRSEGKVIIIDIHYTNWKENSWPNKVDPAYFYSFSVAPADEFKLMLNSAAKLADIDHNGKRVIYDYHGIFVVIKQSGMMGVLSYKHLFLLFLGVIFIESVYRSIFLCVILNCDLDKGNYHKAKAPRDGEVDDLVTKEFHLEGGYHKKKEAEEEDGSRMGVENRSLLA